MPLTAIDYSHTFIYKLCCKDPTITDIYVGHTTNVVKRRQSHKNCCNKDTNKHHNFYVYQFIRDNGGWGNWIMSVLIELSCKDKNEALREERKYLEELQATLNKTIPTRTKKEYRQVYTEQHKEYREHHKEEKAKYNKEYQHQHRDKHIEANRRYREKQKALKELSI